MSTPSVSRLAPALYGLLSVVAVIAVVVAATRAAESTPLVGPADPSHARSKHIPTAERQAAEEWLGHGTELRAGHIRGAEPYWIIYRRHVSNAALDRFEVQGVAVDARTHKVIVSYPRLHATGIWPYFALWQIRASFWRIEAGLLASYLALTYLWAARWEQRRRRLTATAKRRARLGQWTYRLLFVFPPFLVVLTGAVAGVTQDPYLGAATGAFAVPLSIGAGIARGPLRRRSRAIAARAPSERRGLRLKARSTAPVQRLVAARARARAQLHAREDEQVMGAILERRRARHQRATVDAMQVYLLCEVSVQMARQLMVEELQELLDALVESCDALVPPSAHSVLSVISFASSAQVVLPLSPMSDYAGDLDLRFRDDVDYTAALQFVTQTVATDASQLIADGFAPKAPVLILVVSGARPPQDEQWRHAVRQVRTAPTGKARIVVIAASARRPSELSELEPSSYVLARGLTQDGAVMRDAIAPAIKSALGSRQAKPSAPS
jgi:uncharacterized protein YegL